MKKHSRQKVFNGLLSPLLRFLLRLQKLADGFLGQAELHLQCCAQQTDMSQHYIIAKQNFESNLFPDQRYGHRLALSLHLLMLLLQR